MVFNGFIAALLFSVLAAWLFPEGPGLLALPRLINIGIGIIFFFYGLKLVPGAFRAGWRNYKIHILVQLSTFVLFPILTLGFSPLFDGGTHSDLWLSLFFLGALPSTVSSSIVMVSLARGNVPSAIFNATFSGLIGVVMTPLLMSLFMNHSAGFHFLDVVQKLLLQVILPLMAGLLLRPLLGEQARKHSAKISFYDKSIIVLIVYSSFSAAFSDSIFSSVGVFQLAKLTVLLAALFFGVYFLLGLVARKLNLPVEDQITVRFSGTKKSLVHGSVMVQIIFGNYSANALFLLPVMLYHMLQLLVVAHFAERYSRRTLKK